MSETTIVTDAARAATMEAAAGAIVTEGVVTARAVAEVLVDVVTHDLPLEKVLEHPLRDLGVESWAFTTFLAAVEDCFGIEWDFDVPLDVFDSVQTIAAYLSGVKAAR